MNPIDRKLYSGLMGADPASLPMRLGSEAAGVVSAVGEGVELVADRARIVSVAAFGRAGNDGIRLIGGQGADAGTDIRAAARGQLAGSGALRVFVAGSHPLADAADAHRESMAGHATGKIVLTV